MTFADSLAVGNSITSDTWRQALEAFYGTGRVLDMVRIADGANTLQRAGVDYLVVLTNGVVFSVDCKVDTYDNNRIVLEIESNSSTGKPGWLVSTETVTNDLLYFKRELNRFYLFKLYDLRHLYTVNRSDWHRWAEQNQNGFKLIKAKNRSYTSTSIGVPDFVLIQALGDEHMIEVGA